MMRAPHTQWDASMDYRDRHVVVTGGTGALGTAVVGALLEAGALCYVPYRSATDARRFPHQDHPNVRLLAEDDLAHENAVVRVFERVPCLWASIHIAGGFAFGPLSEADSDTLARQIETNLMTCLLCCRAAVQAMAHTGEGGRIVNVAARAALEWRQGANMVAYTASKAAVAALTAALAEEVVGQGILVNAIAPSIMDTPANRKSMPKADHDTWPKVEEVARTILFLASPENKVTRGAVVPVYGRT
jgi:NAD(P)-dependent dehydrogenase (short-subunit alcohol dehydrogenase family)